MIKKVHAVFDGKVFYPEEPLELEINGHYLLKIEPVKTQESVENNKNAQSDPAFDLVPLAVKTGIADLAAGHDHYLYGTSKRESDD